MTLYDAITEAQNHNTAYMAASRRARALLDAILADLPDGYSGRVRGSAVSDGAIVQVGPKVVGGFAYLAGVAVPPDGPIVPANERDCPDELRRVVMAKCLETF